MDVTDVGVSQDASIAIWNHDSILELLTRELARTTREGRNLFLMLVGIDQIGDSSKHSADETETILKEVAGRLSPCLLRYDHVGRYDKDRLLILALSCDEASALPLADRLRQAAEGLVGPSGLHVTVSICLASSADFPLRKPEDILHYLEAVLYRAQSNGSNQVETVRTLNSASAKPLTARRPVPVFVLSVLLLIVAIGVLFAVDPVSTCAPFRLRDVIEPGELPPPLPATCVPTSDSPSEATIQELDKRRRARGLLLQNTITCKIPSSSGARADRARDRQWLANFYADGTFQYRRHIFIAASEEVPGGTLFTVEQCLVPSWAYINQAGDACWDQYAFWR